MGALGYVSALSVVADGSGPALYAGGWFDTPVVTTPNGIAKWDGTSWWTLGSGTNDLVYALSGFGDGSGPAMYAGGWFTRGWKKLCSHREMGLRRGPCAR